MQDSMYVNQFNLAIPQCVHISKPHVVHDKYLFKNKLKFKTWITVLKYTQKSTQNWLKI